MELKPTTQIIGSDWLMGGTENVWQTHSLTELQMAVNAWVAFATKKKHLEILGIHLDTSSSWNKKIVCSATAVNHTACSGYVVYFTNYLFLPTERHRERQGTWLTDTDPPWKLSRNISWFYFNNSKLPAVMITLMINVYLSLKKYCAKKGCIVWLHKLTDWYCTWYIQDYI